MKIVNMIRIYIHIPIQYCYCFVTWVFNFFKNPWQKCPWGLRVHSKNIFHIKLHFGFWYWHILFCFKKSAVFDHVETRKQRIMHCPMEHKLNIAKITFLLQHSPLWFTIFETVPKSKYMEKYVTLAMVHEPQI